MADMLILGGSGFIGRHLLRHLGPERAVGTYGSNPFPGGVPFDPARFSIADWMADGHRFTHALILMGMTRIDGCALDPVASQRVNVEWLQRVVRQCWELGIKPVFTSTDVVFDGWKGGYVESDLPNPLVLYGQQKWVMERFLLDSGLDHLLVRLPKVYSGLPHEPSLLSGWLQAMQRQEPIRCARDRIFSPICISDLYQGLMALVDQGHSGLFHLCGPTPLSMETLFWQFKQRLDDSPHAIETVDVTACSINELGFQEIWPLDISMDPSRLIQTTGLELRTPEQVVDGFVQALGPSSVSVE